MADATLNTNEVTAAPPKGVKMELTRHYVPRELIRIVGWTKPAIIRKTASGEMKEIEPEEWRDGEMKPAAYPGTGFKGKIWAGTVIEVPEAEAKEMRRLRIAEAVV